jgi:hypothetical protein
MGTCLRRLLALGDVFAVSTADSSGQAPLLDVLSSTLAGAAGERSRVSYFRVTQLSPAASTSLLVDSNRTNITLEVISHHPDPHACLLTSTEDPLVA